MEGKTGARVVACANLIGEWLGVRDMRELNAESLRRDAGVTSDKVDLFVLFGGGVIGSAEVLAQAMERNIARAYAVVGGRGHATYGLERAIERLRAECGSSAWWPDPKTASEAEMLAAVLYVRHGVTPDFLETRSTNCGNNIEYLLDVLDGQESVPKSVILCQDAAMQRRMDATWRRQVRDRTRYANTRVINWASYRVRLVWRDGVLTYEDAPEGMWDPRRYLSLLLGDVARLLDDEHGYGPRGADFVDHVDIPDDVRDAWLELRSLLPDDKRLASGSL